MFYTLNSTHYKIIINDVLQTPNDFILINALHTLKVC